MREAPWTREKLLGTRVSDLLDADGRCLRVLVDHGFGPLRQPALRKVLAHTVTLGQAVRIRGLSEEAEEGLLVELLALFRGLEREEATAAEGDSTWSLDRGSASAQQREEAQA